MGAIDWAEKGWVPDSLIRFGINRLNRRRLQQEQVANPMGRYKRYRKLLEQLRESPIAIHTDSANEQHYEVPAEFFHYVLGPRLKYSGCYFPEGVTRLEQAESAMLALTAARAELADGQRILELGCGWGSLTLWMAEHFPGAEILGVSNSASQREHIMQQARDRGLENVQVLTRDVNQLELEQRFDRVVSVEMFEHMRNYQHLMRNISSWLQPDGKLFVHLFCHREIMYPFEVQGDTDWMGRHFFTGGLMPAADTLLHFQDHLAIEEHWRVSGKHYEKTCNHWLENLDRNRQPIAQLFSTVYGPNQADLWVQRWRIFFMACAELFAFADGGEWFVSHYRFANRAG
ncbi:MAG: cyclopropane-fatty-acyl-phospholipid synthase family protein [Xanthomonadales bacterium]|nr:cyclopropane-fatty-acyl-phospholipid synthase family protein [Xanthomonadales bacterium]